MQGVRAGSIASTINLYAPLERVHPNELVLRRRLRSRFVAFVCLELSYIALAVLCLVHPVPCTISSSSTLTKASFTVLFIVWQTIAIMCVRGLVLHVFSSEWYFRFRQSGVLRPGHTDLVSTTTSGFRDRFWYLFNRSSSNAYRLSYLLSWVLIALAGIGPSAINVNDISPFYHATINVTNYTITGGDIDIDLDTPISRTSLITELELRETTPYGYTTPQHIVAAWPDFGTTQVQGDVQFQSDVWFYNYSCQWETPSVNTTEWKTTWWAGGFSWYPWSTPDPGTTFDGGLMPMYRFSTEQTFVPDSTPLTLMGAEPVGLSGFVFFGRNSSFPGIPNTQQTLNLDGLPTIYNESGFSFTGFDNATGIFHPPLATFLVCDPQTFMLDGSLLLTQINASITLKSTDTPLNGEPRVGNISPDAANFVLGISNMDTLENDDEYARIRVGQIGARAFLNDTTLDFDDENPRPDAVTLPLEEIQKQLNLFMQSGAKSTSSYLRDYDLLPPSPLFLVPVEGAIQMDAQELVGSLGFVIATTGLFCVATLVSLYSLYLLRVWQTPAFDLDTLLNISQMQDVEESKESSVYEQPSVQTQHQAPSHSRFDLRRQIGRLLGFLILQAVFFSLVIVCSERPIVVDIPLETEEVKGSFTMLFILWQAVALFLLGDLISSAFSGEWSLQRIRTSRLIPGETDRVSALTAGNEDKVRYFFSKNPSSMFRVAFLTSIVLTVLNSFAPGTLSVGQVTAMVETSLSVADLHLAASSNFKDNNYNFLTDRADTLCLLEEQQQFTFRYEMESNWMMAWPNVSSISSEIIGDLEYPTDVIHFDYSCEWILPELVPNGNVTTWLIKNQTWELWSEPLGEVVYIGGALPLYRNTDAQPDSNFATLVVGTNDSLPVDSLPANRSIINLNNLPTLHHPLGLTLTTPDGTLSNWTSPLTTIFYCDPQVEVSGGRALLTPAKSLSVVKSGLPPVGNIPLDAVTTIFTTSLLEVLDTNDETVPPWIGAESAEIFLINPLTKTEDFAAYPRGVPVHNLTTLNANFNTFALTASKAYLDGLFMDPKNTSNITSHSIPVTCLAGVPRQGLRGDRTLGIVALCLSFVSFLLFGILVRLLLVQKVETFVLDNILPFISTSDDKYSL